MNNLKKTWTYFKLRNSMDSLSSAEILHIIDQKEQGPSIRSRMLLDMLVALFLLFLTQSS